MYLIRKWAFNDMLNIKERQKLFRKIRWRRRVWFFFFLINYACAVQSCTFFLERGARMNEIERIERWGRSMTRWIL